MAGYIFGGEGMPKTPQELEQMREVARSMARRGRMPQNVGEGIASIGDAILYRAMMSRANKAETAGIDSANSAFASLFDGMDDAVAPVTTPDVPPVDTTVTAPIKPIEGTMQNARAADRGSVQDYAGMTLKSGIQSAADALGISPQDLATAISYETAGTFDPLKKGPTTKWGQHKGLIQFGEPQAKENGVDWERPLESQLGPDGAVVKYLRSAGVKPGMGLLDIYSAINAGGVNRYDASDANNGGAWGTVADKVKYQMDGHRKKALALFADTSPTPDAMKAQPGVEQVPVVPVPEGFQQPDPLEQKPTVKVAQALDKKRPKLDVLKASQVLADPFLPPGRRAVLQTLIKQQLDMEQFDREQAAKQADPKYKLDLEKGTLELERLKSPPKSRRLTDDEEKAMGLDASGVYEIDPTDKISTVQQPKDPNSDLTRTKLKLEVLDKVNGEKFRTLTKEEKAQMGLPLDGAFQIDEKTNKVYPIGSGNTNIRVDTGTIPPGYKATRDEQGNIISIEPLPGSKQAQEALDAEAKADLNRTQMALKGDIVSQDIDRTIAALDNKGLPSTGLGSLLSGIPGTNAKAVSSLLDTIKANVSFDTLNQMRQASPTGGALGSVTENELKMLQSTLGSLEQSQDEPTLKDNLNRVWNVYQDIVHGPGKGPERRKLSFQQKTAERKSETAPNEFDGMSDEELEAIINGGR